MLKQKKPRYEMHKYWGKKPSKDLFELIDKYSNEGDTVLDPFAGYGVFVCEAYLNGRNAIGNDLNPFSTFIQEQLLNSNFDIHLFEKEMKRILKENKEHEENWFEGKCPNCGENAKVLSTLRSKDNVPLMNKIKCSCSKTAVEYQLSENEASIILEKENTLKISEHPNRSLIRNGRISALNGMATDDLFTKRTLQCHTHLLNSINTIDDTDIRNFAKFTFTSNLANCSKLVPPIKSRGPMAPGAWMTGFYIGKTYLENNVYHYFNNRISKAISGKIDFIEHNSRLGGLKSKGKVDNISMFDNKSRAYLITNKDTKKLEFPDNSIDYVFTDPPYGDSVPYFEQSAIWNTWLDFDVDYENEVVISDSKIRDKNSKKFKNDIALCIKEIFRVLKNDSYFSITFHSISGKEWYALTSACLKSGFQLKEVQWLTQKTFAPRQLNRKKTVKGDVLITFQKNDVRPLLIELNKGETEELILTEAKKLLKKGKSNTNDIFIGILRKIFSEHILFSEINFIDVLTNNFDFDDDGFWEGTTKS